MITRWERSQQRASLGAVSSLSLTRHDGGKLFRSTYWKDQQTELSLSSLALSLFLFLMNTRALLNSMEGWRSYFVGGFFFFVLGWVGLEELKQNYQNSKLDLNWNCNQNAIKPCFVDWVRAGCWCMRLFCRLTETSLLVCKVLSFCCNILWYIFALFRIWVTKASKIYYDR